MDFDLINEEKAERALLIAVDTGDYDSDVSIVELCELAKTAGADVVGEMIQKRDTVEAGTYVGKGRLEEIAEFCENNEVDIIIADGELCELVEALEGPASAPNEDRIPLGVDGDLDDLILDLAFGRDVHAKGFEGGGQILFRVGDCVFFKVDRDRGALFEESLLLFGDLVEKFARIDFEFFGGEAYGLIDGFSGEFFHIFLFFLLA